MNSGKYDIYFDIISIYVTGQMSKYKNDIKVYSLLRISVLIFLYMIIFFSLGCSRETSAIEEEDLGITDDEEAFFELLETNIISGGPGKDGIPPIESPIYTDVSGGDEWLLPEDVVFGIDHEGLLATYPQRIMVWHEIVNERVGDELLSITYCPLTGTAIGYKGDLGDDMSSTFGVSGNLINSNLVMYDRLTESYWPQILGKAINGDMKGFRLSQFPVVWTTWERWKKVYPQTKVLSRETGFKRDYDLDPYGSYITDSMGYYSSENLFAPVINEDERLSYKTVVVCFKDSDGNAVAVLKDYLRKQGDLSISLGKVKISIEYDSMLDSYSAAYQEDGKWVESFEAMWFSWAAYYPETMLVR